MTADADSVDLEECDNHYKGVVDTLCTDNMDVDSFLNPPFRRRPLPPESCPSIYRESLYDFPELKSSFETLDFYNIPRLYELMAISPEFEFSPDEEQEINQRVYDSMNSSYTPTFENSSHSDIESDLFLVSPNSVLPSIPKEENIESLESVWPELSGLSDEKLRTIINTVDLEENEITIDDLFTKKKRRKLTHLDIDHCYSQRLPVEDDYDDEDEEDFNSPPYSPAMSSCSDQVVSTRGVKRARPKRKNARRKKIKQEVTSSEDEEVDVITPCSVPLVVPKITISIAPVPAPPPARRGRKPKNRSVGQMAKKPNNKNYAVTPKILQAAIQQQKKKCYITKSGRVTKISNSVETTPSTSALSSMSNSRSTSDNEDNVDKRAMHNMAERNRRQELTNLYQGLRVKVPAIKNNAKASKVAILKGGAARVERLQRKLQLKELHISPLKAELERRLAIMQSLLKNSRACSS